MNIVCGDALGISCGTWIAFWNGAVGAFVAAVIGGGVALIVVRLTNAQQRRGVERTVEIAAVSDIVAAIEELEWVVYVHVQPGKPFDPRPYLVPMRAAITRYWMSSRDAEVVGEIILTWPIKLGRLIASYQTAVKREEPYASDILRSISDLSTIAMIALPKFSSTRLGHRSDALASIKQAHRHLVTDVERFEIMVDGKVQTPQAK
ncbi:hypothetical protein OVA06_12945 [Pseudarthrobacter sp. SL88]|uniref:hypothetical protein n=1 Tax=Pseudarthrobacter sp. SL88 TaxID=2994666 RepID=UPI0022765AEC|nr:hypothetical protein [Pseudarthrobacter sp. SL88]MCY1675602.1 hypothetical protein [Pseudarthrobacter sp. SL88]